MRKIVGLTLCGLLYCLPAQAKNCPGVVGVFKDVDGKPMATAPVSLQWRAKRTVTTNADGAFEFADIPCGQYYIVTSSDLLSIEQDGKALSPYATVITVNREKRTTLILVAALKSDPGPEDPVITKLRHDYFVELKPGDAASFEKASLAKQKEMYQNAMGEQLAALTDLTNAERKSLEQKSMGRSVLARLLRELPTGIPAVDKLAEGGRFDANAAAVDKIAAKKAATARLLVQKLLSPQDAEGFALEPDIKNASTFLHAIATLARSHAEPGATTIWFADMDDVYPSARVEEGMEDLLGTDAVKHWPRTDTAQRCKLLQQVSAEVIRIAEGLVNDASPGALESAMAKSKLNKLDHGPQDFLQEEFGAKAVSKYQHSSETTRQEMYRAAIIVVLAWGAADTLM